MSDTFYTNVCAYGGKLYHLGYENGEKFIRVEDEFTPFIGVEAKKETGLKDIYGKNILRKTFDSFREYRGYLKRYTGIIPLYDNIDPKYQFISQFYPRSIAYKFKDISIGLYDIEVYSTDGVPEPKDADCTVTSFCIKHTKTKDIYVAGLKDYDPSKASIEVDGVIQYRKCKNEPELLRHFISVVRNLDLDILCGFFSDGFDDPYMINRIKKILGDDALKGLSPIGQLPTSYHELDHKNMNVYRNYIPAISLLDFQRLYKKYSVGDRERYSLSFISQYEKVGDKLDHEEYDNLCDFYDQNHQLFIDYNIIDVELISLLEAKLKLIELHCAIAYRAHCNFQDVFSPVKTWDCYIFSKLTRQDICIPPMKENFKEDFPGAFVKEPKGGVYGWMLSWDLDSLYPLTAVQYNISPETLIPKRLAVDDTKIDDRFINREIDTSGEYIVAGNGYRFRKDKVGILPQIFQEVFDTRKVIKNEGLRADNEYQQTKDPKLKELANDRDIEQLALKILINSCYGALGQVNFRYYDLRLASAITLSGQLAIKFIMVELEKWFEKKNLPIDILYADTDSIYMVIDEVVGKHFKGTPAEITEKVNTKLVPVIEKFIQAKYEDLRVYMNCDKGKMVMKREKIIECAIFGKKKRYAMMVWDNEGVRYNEAKFSVTGFEMVRSSTPAVVKPFIKEALILYMKDQSKIPDLIADTKRKFMEFHPLEIASPRSANNIKKYSCKKDIFISGTPIGVKSAIVYNDYLERHRDEYPLMNPIYEGDKIKYIYLLSPNPFMNKNVVGFRTKLFEESHRRYFDYEKQFESVFVKPVRNIATHCDLEFDDGDSYQIDDLF